MWTNPRPTIRSLLQKDPRYGVSTLSAVYVMQTLFYLANFYSVGLSTKFYAILLAILILSPLLGLAWVYVLGWIYTLVGRGLGGTAPALHIRSALAWSRAPLMLSALMWLILLMAHSETVFVQSATGVALVFVNLISCILGIWCFVLFVQSIREVQSFSLLRSIANVLLGDLAIGILFFLFIFVYLIIFHF